MGKKSPVRGNDTPKQIEPTETYLVNFFTTKKIITEARTCIGASNIEAPKVVFTPFPPFSFKKIEKSCPRIAANAIR